MKWKDWLFGDRQRAAGVTKGHEIAAEPSQETLEVSNPFRAGLGSRFVVAVSPDLERCFGSADPPIPYEVTEKSQEYWRGITLEEKRSTLAMAYLQHPDPWIRLRSIGYAKQIRTLGVAQMLVNLLADRSFPEIARAAAAAIWERNGDDDCKFAVHALRDEIRGYVAGPAGHTEAGLMLSRDDAIRALDFLVAGAPDEERRRAIERLIDEDVIIEERVKQVDTRSIRFVGLQRKDPYTYEVYWAKGKEQAIAFLSKKKVEKEMYYIEVETPEGNFGRDMKGIYEL